MVRNAITDTVLREIPFDLAMGRTNSLYENMYASAMYLGMSVMFISCIKACNWAAKNNKIRCTVSLLVCLVAIANCNMMLLGAEKLNLDNADNLALILLITTLTMILIYGRMVFFKLMAILARRLGRYLQKKANEYKSHNKE